jgi:DNA-binding transcriptional MerR regulator
MQAQTFQLKEAASILGAAPSALRYWDAQGLIDIERDPQNNYRRLSMRSLLAASDIAFYRNELDIPLKELAGLPSFSALQLDDMLARQMSSVESQIEQLRGTQRRLTQQRLMVSTAVGLEGRAPFPSETEIARIAKMDPGNQDHLGLCLREPQKFAFFIDARSPGTCIDGIVDEGALAHEEVLWERQADTISLECLMKTPEDDYSESNAPELLDQARAGGFDPRYLVGYFLMTQEEGGRRIDRNRAWIICA